MKNELENLKQIAHGLAQQFGETCENCNSRRTDAGNGRYRCLY